MKIEEIEMADRKTEISSEIADFVKNNFFFSREDREIKNDESLIENGVIDSTGVLELIDFLEDRFEISIENEEVIPENLDSIGHMSDFVIRKEND